MQGKMGYVLLERRKVLQRLEEEERRKSHGGSRRGCVIGKQLRKRDISF